MADSTQLVGLLTDAQSQLRAGKSGPALEILAAAQELFPDSHDVYINLAMAHRAEGALLAALGALDKALAIDPYSFLALLAKGSVLEQTGRVRSAAEIYKNALKISPQPDRLPANLAQQLSHASSVVQNQATAQAKHLRDLLGPLEASEPNEHRRRFSEAVDIASGIARAHQASPIQLHYPRLPAIPFFDTEHFPWMGDLEAATTVITEELKSLQNTAGTNWSPYVQYAPGTPENQFAALNNNRDWSSIWLWRDGASQPAASLCPGTMSVLEQVPLADQPGFAPTALFSALAPKTAIPPHTGSTNTRLLVHLPLILPGPAFFRVGNEERQWELGKAWAFDDTIEHEARNDADETRIILIFDVWNPLLSDGEKEKVRVLLSAQRAWLNEEMTS